MTLGFSVNVRNAELNAIESTIGASAVLKIFSGAMPLTTADANTGTVLAVLNLPADWMSAASSGIKSKSGTWSELSADASGDAGYFRIFESDGTTCDLQGTITVTGGGGDMTIDDVSIFETQTVTVTNFTLTAGNA